MAVLATDPALGYLSTVSGVTRQRVHRAVDLVNAPVWNGVKPNVVVSANLGGAGETLLRAAGLVRTGDRILALKRLDAWPASAMGTADRDVVDAGEDNNTFVDVLLAGYQADGVIAAFIRAEHGFPTMRRFLVVERKTPIAAAAMTIHDNIAVLGAASTLLAHRRRGAQSRLLQHRLRTAAKAGCALAVATARPDSVSAANLRKAGFHLHRRSVWTKS
ncbi:hypothetical protein [Amycolatopsis taiwanensis]|uniref:hypothetical protein n=1 Tax=Amycolatopsis taiwanensis TaxID=342230 RepID=UPI0012EC68EA|nr:hypothetical protein [Amycolatopsis taiwanensis]